ncbi:MAG TPA: hypothetical protein VFF77_03590 [Holophagaceae bacterium]|jgi:hypothetical protein|nr:hypothetical protein [Holophagaceae bacterium]
MNIPDHYRALYRTWLRFAIVMMIFGLLIGLSFEESAKRAPVSDLLPAGKHLEAILPLALVHGHAFLLGAVLPMMMVFMLHLGLTLGFRPLGAKTLKTATWLYLPGSALSVALLLYKGYHWILGVRFGHTDFAAWNGAFFAGNHALRAASYGIAHTAMSVGMAVLVIAFWRSMGTRAGD